MVVFISRSDCIPFSLKKNSKAMDFFRVGLWAIMFFLRLSIHPGYLVFNISIIPSFLQFLVSYCDVNRLIASFFYKCVIMETNRIFLMINFFQAQIFHAGCKIALVIDESILSLSESLN